MTDQTLPEAEARSYLNAKFDQLGAAIRSGDKPAAMAVVQQIRDDGYPEVADEVLDGLIEAVFSAGPSTTPDS